MSKKKGLTAKQRAFAEAYLRTFNATQAAREAGYSEKTAYSIGWENLRKPEIAEYVQFRLREAVMSADEVLMRLAEEARGDMGDFWEIPDYGAPTLALGKAKDKLHLIRKIKVKTTTRRLGEVDITTSEIDFELYSAQAAKDILLKHHDRGPTGNEDDPIHTIAYIREVRPEQPARDD